jgi:catechol 2,3-dioxygenase
MSISPDARIGAVRLVIANLDRSVRFYTEHLGFVVHRQAGDTAALGAGRSDLLVLRESPDAPRPHRTTGLYHFAILVPSRPGLSRVLANLAGRRTPMQGFSDHGVSEAIYLADPDGNGIEVYRDRPRTEWPTDGGRLRMGTEPLDVESLLRVAAEISEREGRAPWPGLPHGTCIGHVHLHVAFLEDTEAFYTQVLGFDLTQRYGESALFLAAGGYHHHIGANTWAGVGAPRPPAGAIGLDRFVIELPDDAALAEVAGRLGAAGVEAEIGPESMAIEDPSGNRIELRVVSGASRPQ